MRFSFSFLAEKSRGDSFGSGGFSKRDRVSRERVESSEGLNVDKKPSIVVQR